MKLVEFLKPAREKLDVRRLNATEIVHCHLRLHDFSEVSDEEAEMAWRELKRRKEHNLPRILAESEKR